MKYFLDTEFLEQQGSIELISIGIVSVDDSLEYYAETDNAKELCKKSSWLMDNVFPSLKLDTATVRSREQIKKDILNLIKPEDLPEFYGYYASYDWVVFCWLFGSMCDLPEGYPMFIYDLKQSLANCPARLKAPKQVLGEHNALADAKYVKELYQWIHKWETAKETGTINL